MSSLTTCNTSNNSMLWFQYPTSTMHVAGYRTSIVSTTAESPLSTTSSDSIHYLQPGSVPYTARHHTSTIASPASLALYYTYSQVKYTALHIWLLAIIIYSQHIRTCRCTLHFYIQLMGFRDKISAVNWRESGIHACDASVGSLHSSILDKNNPMKISHKILYFL